MVTHRSFMVTHRSFMVTHRSFMVTHRSFMVTHRSFSLRIKNVSDKVCREKTNEDIHYLFNIFSFENGAVYEIMFKNMVQPDRQQTTIRHMRISCWLTKAADIQPEYTRWAKSRHTLYST
jgi:hypothetical protein